MSSFSVERRIRLPMLKAGWRKQTFLHWRFPPDEVQPLLPDGLVVDRIDGAAWVSLTPFVMVGLRPGVPAPAGLAAFPETNLRTYVRTGDGRDGILFLTIDVAQPLSEAAVEECQETVTVAAGLPAPGGAPVVHYSEGVRRVRLGIPRPLRISAPVRTDASGGDHDQ